MGTGIVGNNGGRSSCKSETREEGVVKPFWPTNKKRNLKRVRVVNAKVVRKKSLKIGNVPKEAGIVQENRSKKAITKGGFQEKGVNEGERLQVSRGSSIKHEERGRDLRRG